MLPYFVVDAFTDRAYAGNPAAVVFLPGHDWPDKARLSAIAAEFNLAETAFVLEAAPNGTRGLRWLTPAVEVPLCGHATLGTAQALWQSGRQALDQPLHFETLSGRLSCVRDADGLISLDFPACPVRPCDVPPALFAALTRPNVIDAAQDERYFLLETDDEASLRALSPLMASLAVAGPSGVIVTARAQRDQLDFVSRFFAPKLGVPEDPVTGSAHCRLGPYWAAKLGKTKLKAEQVSSRGGRMDVEVLGERVRLSGRAVAVAKGELLEG
jgi:predicted PhzF superfamily epimerase YddE/YHI9